MDEVTRSHDAPADEQGRDGAALLDELRAALGDALVVDAGVRDAARADRSGHVAPSAPLGVVEARSADDVRATLRWASRHRIPVVPRGAGTGLAGAAIGGAGELVLSTRSMTRILEVSAVDELAVVEPGILNGELNARLAGQGLWWAPDPASREISTVGGNIATNAGGLLCAKYGVTREAVLGLTVITADGETLETGHRTVKGVTGYDVTALMIGSEGTLGVIVAATLKLRPLPTGPEATLAARFDDVEAAASAAAAISAEGLRPAISELLDRGSVARIGAYLASEGIEPPLRPDGAHLLVRFDGADAVASAERALALTLAVGGEGRIATDAAEGERLFAMRRAFHPAMAAGGTVLIEDVAVPRSALARMFAELERIERESGIPIPTVAHAGDGNLHPNFVFVAERDADGHEVVPDAVWDAADAMFRAALALGGTLTGEHGVGILKRRWLVDELGERQLALQRGIKAVFDPLGILNPGKALGDPPAAPAGMRE